MKKYFMHCSINSCQSIESIPISLFSQAIQFVINPISGCGMFETLTCLNNAVLKDISVAYTHTNTHAHT